MDSLNKHALSAFGTSVNILPYLGPYHVAQIMMHSLCHSTKELWDKNCVAFHRAFDTQNLKVDFMADSSYDHETSNDELSKSLLSFLLKNNRYASYTLELNMNIKASAEFILQLLHSVDHNLLTIKRVNYIVDSTYQDLVSHKSQIFEQIKKYTVKYAGEKAFWTYIKENAVEEFAPDKEKDSENVKFTPGDLLNTEKLHTDEDYSKYNFIKYHQLDDIDALNSIKIPIEQLLINKEDLCHQLVNGEIEIDEIHKQNVKSVILNFPESIDPSDLVKTVHSNFTGIERMSFEIENIK